MYGSAHLPQQKKNMQYAEILHKIGPIFFKKKRKK